MIDKHSNDFAADEFLEVPEPFERTVANVQLRHTSNSVDQGVDLEVHANFGSEYATISLEDGGAMEVRCDIYEAMILAKPFNCRFTAVEDPDGARGFVGEQRYSDGSQSELSNSAEGHLNGELSGPKKAVSASAKTSLASAAKSSQSEKLTIEASQTYRQVEFGVDEIRIRRRPDGLPLEGTLIDRVNCLRVLPKDPSKPFGVVLRLQVKKNWMHISDVEEISFSEKLKSLVTSVLKRDNPEEEFNREAFRVLLNHLVNKGLQLKESGQYATLAARAFRGVQKSDDNLEVTYSELAQRDFRLPIHHLEAVLASDRQTVLKILAQHGLLELVAPNDEEGPLEFLLPKLGFDPSLESEEMSIESVLSEVRQALKIEDVLFEYKLDMPERDYADRVLFVQRILSKMIVGALLDKFDIKDGKYPADWEKILAHVEKNNDFKRWPKKPGVRTSLLSPKSHLVCLQVSAVGIDVMLRLARPSKGTEPIPDELVATIDGRLVNKLTKKSI